AAARTSTRAMSSACWSATWVWRRLAWCRSTTRSKDRSRSLSSSRGRATTWVPRTSNASRWQMRRPTSIPVSSGSLTGCRWRPPTRSSGRRSGAARERGSQLSTRLRDEGRGPMTEVDRRLPVGDEIFLDHVAHFVVDHERASRALARVGFAPTPVSVQVNHDPVDGSPGPTGTGNVTCMLDRGYFEILFKTSDTALSREFDAAISRYHG